MLPFLGGLGFLGNSSQVLLMGVPRLCLLLLLLPSPVFCVAAESGGVVPSPWKAADLALDRFYFGLFVPLSLKPLEATLISL